MTLGALLQKQAGNSPKVAFIMEWSSGGGGPLMLSFEEFFAAVAAAHKSLAARGIEGGNRVALLSHPITAFFVNAYAVMAAGGACALLNWRQPASVLVKMIADSGCVVLLSSAAFSERVRACYSLRSSAVKAHTVALHAVGR